MDHVLDFTGETESSAARQVIMRYQDLYLHSIKLNLSRDSTEIHIMKQTITEVLIINSILFNSQIPIFVNMAFVPKMSGAIIWWHIQVIDVCHVHQVTMETGEIAKVVLHIFSSFLKGGLV